MFPIFVVKLTLKNTNMKKLTFSEWKSLISGRQRTQDQLYCLACIFIIVPITVIYMFTKLLFLFDNEVLATITATISFALICGGSIYGAFNLYWWCIWTEKLESQSLIDELKKKKELLEYYKNRIEELQTKLNQ
jgi:hypothetical protein